MTQELTEANFVENTDQGVVVVDFYATWCGPCRALAPVLEQLQNAKVVKVDIDQNQQLGVQYNVAALPTVIFLKDGVEVDRVVGLQPQKALQAKVDALNGPPQTP